MEYKVIRETLFNCFDKQIGKSVLLVQWSTECDDVDCCIDDTTIYHSEDTETSYGMVEWQGLFMDKKNALDTFYNESILIKNR